MIRLSLKWILGNSIVLTNLHSLFSHRKRFLILGRSSMRWKCAAMILRSLARVDPWLGLRLNLAMNKQIALLLIILLGAGLNGFAQTELDTRRADRSYRRSHEEIPRDA